MKKQRSPTYAKHPKKAKEWGLKYGNKVEKKKSAWADMKPSSKKGD